MLCLANDVISGAIASRQAESELDVVADAASIEAMVEQTSRELDRSIFS